MSAASAGRAHAERRIADYFKFAERETPSAPRPAPA